MVIEVNKDIDRYQESVAMGLTARQLIFSIASVVVGGGIVLLLYKYIGLTGSAYVAIPCVAPIALGGFYSFNGMNFYEYMGKKLHFMFGNRALTYVSTEGEPAIKQLEAEQNEQVKKKGRSLINLGKHYYCVDIDIKGFFDNVNHGKLMKQIWNLGIRDKRLLCIISKLLKCEIEGEGIPTKGTPQGGILSPLLSNIVAE